MTTANFSDVAGIYETNPEHLTNFVNGWFAPDDLVTIAYGHGAATHNATLDATELARADSETLDKLIALKGGRQDVYFTINPQTESATNFRRGGKKNVKEVIGLFADLDVKPGSFASESEVLEFLADLPIKPTAIVTTGSGGVHAYWKLTQRLPVEPAEKLQRKFTVWLQDRAGDRSIDRLTDASRVLRLPGTMRFPKDSEPVASVKLHSMSGKTHSLEFIEGMVSDAWIARHNAVTATKRVESQLMASKASIAHKNNVKTAELEALLNTFDWSDILTPSGWTELERDWEGRRVWARPGADRRSATTDYVDENGVTSNVMTLFSAAPETGLDDLLDADTILSKYRVALRYFYNDDPNVMAQAFGLQTAEPVVSDNQFDEDGKVIDPATGQPFVSRLVGVDTMKQRTKKEWLVTDRIHKTGLAQIYGPSNTGKTILLVDLFLSYCAGMTSWMGHKLNTGGKPQTAVYVAAEDTGIGDYVNAWQVKHNVTDRQLEGANFIASSLGANLRVGRTVEFSDSMDRLKIDLHNAGIKPGLVVFDTQIDVIEGDENSNNDVVWAFRELKQWGDTEGFIGVLIHHTGHDASRARGASGMKGKVDVMAGVSPVGNSGNVKIKWEKVKGARIPETEDFYAIEGMPDRGIEGAYARHLSGPSIKDLAENAWTEPSTADKATILRVTQDGASKRVIADALGCDRNTSRFKNAIGWLTLNGQIESDDNGKIHPKIN